MAKEIKYKKKYTKANTQYIEVNSLDRKFIVNELMKMVEFINECKTFDHPDLNRILYETTVLDTNLPKMGYKPYKHNSMYSYINGLLHNLTIGGQQNLTEQNIEPIQYISTYFENNLNNFTQITFTKS